MFNFGKFTILYFSQKSKMQFEKLEMCFWEIVNLIFLKNWKHDFEKISNQAELVIDESTRYAGTVVRFFKRKGFGQISAGKFLSCGWSPIISDFRKITNFRKFKFSIFEKIKFCVFEKRFSLKTLICPDGQDATKNDNLIFVHWTQITASWSQFPEIGKTLRCEVRLSTGFEYKCFHRFSISGPWSSPLMSGPPYRRTRRYGLCDPLEARP